MSKQTGAACDEIESLIGGVALFINGDAGDIDPTSATCDCHNGVCNFAGAKTIANTVQQVRQSLKVLHHHDSLIHCT